MTDVKSQLKEWAWKIEFVLHYLELEDKFGKHMFLENNNVCVCRQSGSEYRKILNNICKNIPLYVFRAILVAMRITTELHCCGKLQKSGKRYFLYSTNMHLDEYIDQIRKSGRTVLAEELKRMGLSHPHYKMIDLAGIIPIETIYKDFSNKRFPVWTYPGGLTIKAKDKIKKEKLKIVIMSDLN